MVTRDILLMLLIFRTK